MASTPPGTRPARSCACCSPSAGPATSCRSTVSTATSPPTASWRSPPGSPAANVAAVDNGRVVEIDADGLRVLDPRVPAGYVYVDGLSLEDATDVVFRDRRQLAEDGLIIVHLAVERSTGAVVAGPELIARGFVEDGDGAGLFEEAQSAGPRDPRAPLAPDAGLGGLEGRGARGPQPLPLQADPPAAADPPRGHRGLLSGPARLARSGARDRGLAATGSRHSARGLGGGARCPP